MLEKDEFENLCANPFKGYQPQTLRKDGDKYIYQVNPKVAISVSGYGTSTPEYKSEIWSDTKRTFLSGYPTQYWGGLGIMLIGNVVAEDIQLLNEKIEVYQKVQVEAAKQEQQDGLKLEM